VKCPGCQRDVECPSWMTVGGLMQRVCLDCATGGLRRPAALPSVNRGPSAGHPPRTSGSPQLPSFAQRELRDAVLWGFGGGGLALVAAVAVAARAWEQGSPLQRTDPRSLVAVSLFALGGAAGLAFAARLATFVRPGAMILPVLLSLPLPLIVGAGSLFVGVMAHAPYLELLSVVSFAVFWTWLPMLPLLVFTRLVLLLGQVVVGALLSPRSDGEGTPS
jgi:hypothetical protein